MNRLSVWARLICKSFFVHKTVYVLAFSFFVLCFLLRGLSYENDKPVGLYVGNVYKGDVIAGQLCKDGKFVLYDDDILLNADIRSGKLECGFFFGDDYENLILSERYKKPISVLSRAGYVYTEVNKEQVIAAIMYALSDRIIEDEAKRIFADCDDETVKEIVSSKESYFRSDVLFDADVVYFDTSARERGGSLNMPLFVEILMFAAMLAGSRERFGPQYKAVRYSMRQAEGKIFDCLSLLIAGLFWMITAIVVLLVCYPDAGTVAFVSIIITSIVCIVWIAIFESLVLNETVYTALCAAFVLIAFIVCPVFWDCTVLWPWLGIIRLVLPIVG